MSNTNIRASACQVVHAVAEQHLSLTALLPAASACVPEKDKGLLQELVFGTCRWYYQLADQHNRYLAKPIHASDKIAQTLIKVGAYQLQHTRIPAHAAIHETVAAADLLGVSHLKGLINAVLRKISAESKTDQPDSVNHPLWMVEKIRHNWPDNWQSILHNNDLHPPMTLRVNRAKISREHYLLQLDQAQIKAKAGAFADYALVLDSAVPVTQLPGFAAGEVSIQDEAAQLCCQLLELKPNLRVLDACAAPGGKTCALLETEPSLQLLALDADQERSKLITENLARLTLAAEIRVARAEATELWWNGHQFDRILLDAPCSATGVIRRHPDIKLLRQESDINNLAQVQLKLLSALWPTLKLGGKLLYATCSIFPQENSRIIERFLKQEPSAELLTIEAKWGVDTGFGRQLFPQTDGHDGFFYACLTKSAHLTETDSRMSTL